MKQPNQYLYNSPVGILTISSNGNAITRIVLNSEKTEANNIHSHKDPIIEQCITELEEYFKGKRKTFTVPVDTDGTPFQKSIWTLLTLIPYGDTASYKDIAIKANSPKGFRAVGMANHYNPVPIIIPCHRVVNSNGTLGGYALGLDVKEQLLSLEKNAA